MPIYEYHCESCGQTLEAMQRMSDDPLTQCPACGENSLKKLVSAAGFRLSGKGWYETDFKKNNQRNLSQKEEKKSAAEPACGSGGCSACVDASN